MLIEFFKTLIMPMVVGFVGSLLFIKILIPLATRLGLVDVPGGRKQHLYQTPLIGGIAMFLSFGVSILLFDISLHMYRAFLASAFLLVFTGVLDDFHELTPRFRLFVQVVTGAIMVIWGNVTLHDLGNFLYLDNIHLDFTTSLIISICAVIGIIMPLIC